MRVEEWSTVEIRKIVKNALMRGNGSETIKLTMVAALKSIEAPEEEYGIEGMEIKLPSGYNYFTVSENNQTSSYFPKLGTIFYPVL